MPDDPKFPFTSRLKEIAGLLGIKDYRRLAALPGHSSLPDRRILSRLWENGPLRSKHRHIADALWHRLQSELDRQRAQRGTSPEWLEARRLLGESLGKEYGDFLELAQSQYEKEPPLKKKRKAATWIDASLPTKVAQIPQFRISDGTGRESQRASTKDAGLNKYRRLMHVYHQCNEDNTSEYRNTYWTYIRIDFSQKKQGGLYSEFEIPEPYNDNMPCSALGLLFPGFLTISFNSPYWIQQRKAHYLFFTKEKQDNRGHWGIIYYERESHVGANACLITYEPICDTEVAGRQDEKKGGALDKYWRELIEDYFGFNFTPLFKKLSQYRGI